MRTGSKKTGLINAGLSYLFTLTGKHGGVNKVVNGIRVALPELFCHRYKSDWAARSDSFAARSVALVT